MVAVVDENLLQTRNFSIHWLVYLNTVPNACDLRL